MVQPIIVAKDFEKITRKLKGIRGGTKKAISRAASRVATQAKTKVSRGVTEEIAAPAKEVKKVIAKKKTGGGWSIELAKSKRLGVRHFKARQTKKGTGWKIDKRGARTFVTGAFQGPKPGQMNTRWKGNAFKRVGKARKPIVKMQGPSPWGAFVKNNKSKPTRKFIRTKFRERLIHEVNHLLRTAK